MVCVHTKMYLFSIIQNNKKHLKKHNLIIKNIPKTVYYQSIPLKNKCDLYHYFPIQPYSLHMFANSVDIPNIQTPCHISLAYDMLFFTQSSL